jgi:hypothetical protein
MPSVQRRSRVTCPYCGAENDLGVASGIDDGGQSLGTSLRIDDPVVRSAEENDAEEDQEFTLLPGIERPGRKLVEAIVGDLPAASGWEGGHGSQHVRSDNYRHAGLGSEHDDAVPPPIAAAKERVLPRRREYPTLEAVQRLYRLLGYTTVAVVFPYLGFRLLAILVATEGSERMDRLIEFSQFAIPLMFGSVAVAGTLLAASEGIRLVIDLQQNTLTIAREINRR